VEFIDVGFGNSVNCKRIIAIVSADTAPSRRICSAAKDKNLLIDATCGKKTTAIIIMDSGHIIQTHKNITYFSKYNNPPHNLNTMTEEIAGDIEETDVQ
jgi:regulator of extracellular matrix RemA (YlzA/DUF370 family)